MTDNEIIKALPFIAKYCKREYNDIRVDELLLGALDLIKRQDAEIKKLRYNLEAVLDERADHSEAIIEFAERLKLEAYTETGMTGYKYQSVVVEDIDNLLKEMVGDNDE